MSRSYSKANQPNAGEVEATSSTLLMATHMKLWPLSMEVMRFSMIHRL